jgi:ATP-dependent Clp protease ATP-binding subunit ClpB
VRAENKPRLDEKVERTATEAAKRKFAPEFMNRIDKVVVFRALGGEELEQVLDIELVRVRERIMASDGSRPFVFECTSAGREFLLQEGTDSRYGARHLKRAIERHVVFPLASLMTTGQIGDGDVVVADHDLLDGRLSFAKRAGGVLVQSAAA